MSAVLLSFLLGLTAAGANVFGGVLVVRRTWPHAYVRYFMAVGAGFMLGVALLEMVPEGLRLAGRATIGLVLLGYLLVHFFEHTITAHFHFGEEVHVEEMMRPQAAYAAVLGMVIHSFFDGMAIAAGFVVSATLGVLVFVAVFLHKVPAGFTVSSVMLASGRGTGRALGAAVVTGAATLVGLGVMWGLQGQVAYWLLLSAGTTLYVAASDLMPEVNREPGILMPIWVFVGVALMLALRVVFHL